MQPKLQWYDVLGVPITVTDLNHAASVIADWRHDPRGRAVGVRDVASLMALQADPHKIAVSRRTAMNVPDGMPLVWIGRWRGLPVGRTCGPDLMAKVIFENAGTGLKHFFYGGKEGVAEALADAFCARANGIEIVGTYCPPFRPLTAAEDEDVVKAIKASGAHIVWVGISSPKQDLWMNDHLDTISATMIGVGAAFDYHAGIVRRAPIWAQKAGLEWLYRLASEPRRLWRRYLLQVPLFLWKLMTQKSHQ